MALQEKHRTRLYAHLVEHIDEDTAEAVLAQFPSRDLDEPVTKEFVALQVSLLRTELHQEVGVLRTEMHQLTERLLNRVQLVAALSVIVLSIVNAIVG